MNNKGSLLDFFFIIVFLVAFSITVLVSTYIKDQLFTPMSTMLSDSPTSVSILNDVGGSFVIWDFVFLFLAIGGGIATLVLAVLVPMHPMFFFINLVVIVVLFLVVPTLSNVVREIWLQPQFVAYETNYPMMLAMMRYLPYLFLGFSMLLSIVMYSKSRDGY